MIVPFHDAPPDVAVREFIPSDGEGIVTLIRRNYGETYHKRLFYDPDHIRNANARGQTVSVVALYFETVIGHFALFPSEFSNIAEIGAAAVDPAFKHLGVMNRMFDLLVTVARSMKFSALYGEAIMLHPFSQKANLHHGMRESAILLGEVPSTIEIEHRYKDAKRSGGMEAFLLFDTRPRALCLPERYAAIIAETYLRTGIALMPPSAPPLPASCAPGRHYSPMLNIGYLVFDALSSAQELDAAIEEHLHHRCDMIYADINLHRIGNIDALVALLNGRRFFYAGVMFMLYGNEDYLRLQRKNIPAIDEEGLVCYSEFAKALLTYILEDERKVMEGRKAPQ